MGEAVKLTGASRNTLKGHFRTLVERGRLISTVQAEVFGTSCVEGLADADFDSADGDRTGALSDALGW